MKPEKVVYHNIEDRTWLSEQIRVCIDTWEKQVMIVRLVLDDLGQYAQPNTYARVTRTMDTNGNCEWKSKILEK